MRNFIVAILTLFALSAGTLASAAEPEFDWKPWRSLAVQDGGRQKPLDSLAWETWRLIGNRSSFADPDTGQPLDATALYLSMLMDWQGWDRGAKSPAAGTCTATHASHSYAPDKWDQSACILVDSLELRTALGMPETQKYISPLGLTQAKIQDPKTKCSTPLLVWTQKLVCAQNQELSALERNAIELSRRLRAYQDHRAGRRLEVAPMPDSEENQWASLDYLLRASLDDRTDPSGGLRELKDKFLAVRAAYLAKSPRAFNEASTAFLAAARRLGPELGAYPPAGKIDLEVAYNHWVPFRFAWVLVLCACLGLFLEMGTGWKRLYGASIVAYLAGLAAMVAGFVMRVAISNRAPVTNMYESVLYVGLGVAALGLVLELIYRKRFCLAAAAVVSTLALVLADNCPAVLDPSLQPLQPVLRNNFWLVTHVMTITLSYAAFALALGIGNITLGYYLAGSRNREAIESLSRFCYRTLQVGVVLLAVGTVTGGIWADYSWGRFWGWDPKEVWALVTLLGYVAVLHARYAGWVAHFGLAALSVLCFSLVVVAWYGVNFIMGTGLHSYGAGGGGGGIYVGGALAIQFLYVLLAAGRIGEPGPSPSPARMQPHKAPRLERSRAGAAR
jgi:ABC-type transport system involved in cytochrome c biogenesis permease subunit